MRIKYSLPVLAAILSCVASPAGAVLKHYSLSWLSISDFNTTNPTPDKYPPGKGGPQSTDPAFIDDTNNGSPVLRRLLLTNETELTVNVPGLSGFIFLSSIQEQGPKKGSSFTGTGDTSTTIAWGLVTGWTLTGGFYCHSFPSYICTYAGGSDLATVDRTLESPLYDLGTWTFHGTGFTSIPFVHQIASPNSVGNNQYYLRGRLAGGLVPALPVLGVALLGASLLFAGARLARER
jgi:hypothetical protein